MRGRDRKVIWQLPGIVVRMVGAIYCANPSACNIAHARAQDRISGVQIFVLLVSVATVGLWCANGALADVFGEMGIIAVLPMVAFFGFGVLGKARQ